ncbi:endonuclease/exonuclease/phosphatase family protein [Aquirhabdus sp.]|uniref:endonuclease/exonuclease/phosphatase family protein n=1 Tax=Aquirhabdus sp. TaxID=2824160 RepID=UPI00396CCA22
MIIIEFVAGVVVFATLWALISRNEWWVRCFDFPRLQILSVGCVAWLGLILASSYHQTIEDPVLFVILTGCLVYQSWMILPYTFLWKKQVLQAHNPDPDNAVSVLVSNVLTPNKNYQALIDHVQNYQPDLLVTLETDWIWERALSVIEADYPYVVRVPLDNMYGMHLYSRLPLVNPEVKFLLSPEIPSIHTQVRLRSGQLMRLYCLHPKPPTPNEALDSTLRDAELLMVGDHVASQRESCIVVGDLNDVAWSRTTRLFQRISGLLDPRIGRKFMNTFHVNYMLLRWSLDHVFHSHDFTLVEMSLLESIDSDHFPVYTVLHFDPAMQSKQIAPTPSADDEHLALAKINAGIMQARREAPRHQRDPLMT